MIATSSTLTTDHKTMVMTCARAGIMNEKGGGMNANQTIAMLSASEAAPYSQLAMERDGDDGGQEKDQRHAGCAQPDLQAQRGDQRGDGQRAHEPCQPHRLRARAQDEQHEGWLPATRTGFAWTASSLPNLQPCTKKPRTGGRATGVRDAVAGTLTGRGRGQTLGRTLSTVR